MREALLSGVQKVELVGGESWVEHNSVAVAAIAAAVIAALVAVLNRRAQLRHDREMRNREHVRDTIDDAVIAANQVRTNVDRLVAAVVTEEANRKKPGYTASQQRRQVLGAKQQKAIAGLHEMRAARTRLEIRLESSDEVVTAYTSTFDAFLSVFENTHTGVLKDRPPDVRAGDEDRDKEFRSAFRALQDACRTWFGDARPST